MKFSIQSRRTICFFFNDGSKLSNRNAGAGCVIFQHDGLVSSATLPLGTGKEVIEPKSHAAFYSIKAAIALPRARFSNDLWKFLDYYEVVTKLLTETLIFHRRKSTRMYWKRVKCGKREPKFQIELKKLK